MIPPDMSDQSIHTSRIFKEKADTYCDKMGLDSEIRLAFTETPLVWLHCLAWSFPSHQSGFAKKWTMVQLVRNNSPTREPRPLFFLFFKRFE
jgi:hypothetical protein